MTIAIDRATGAVVGQVVAIHPGIYLGGGNPHTLDCPPSVQLLTRDGYATVPSASVEIEEVN